ncbi:hypothetical protein ASC95_15435 [Pelomonas sp. Root1217]|uniref:DUF2145 domain-containing protein n=1 Tax=Pelomonas sp. Root1217 TaxID=1736430 RepID=UPI000709D33D|nr:DUF2145 domain-containing protein [Pelomonas sp. Root1217]KQV50741.1 hypothetical protein ASC95_15435 [Pelomonas sp. Root1217]
MTQTALAAALLLTAAAAQAGLPPRGCDPKHDVTAAQQDRLLRFSAVVRQALAESGSPAALISRSGTDLSRFGLRYSHAGIALADGLDTPWAVRQLYYACVEGAPRLFDQGLAGFISGSDNADVGYVSLLLLPPEAAAALAATALDKPVALGLLDVHYSANAYPFSTRYQNCNQWVAELLAAASAGPRTRADAQAWLQREGYAPAPVQAPGWLLLAGHAMPWLHFDDQPRDQLRAGAVQTSLPDSLEAFALRRWPAARRIELCHGPQGVVRREGGAALAAGCVPQPGDHVMALK